jgi:diaminopimelate epimerase
MGSPKPFSKYHALGNDYLVVEHTSWGVELSTSTIRQLCHRNFGIGSDGVLLHLPPNADNAFRLRIYNPDGSEAEKSGNGLRIFARYLYDHRLVTDTSFSVATLGGTVRCLVASVGDSVQVEMGELSFDSQRIPVTGPQRDVLREPISVGDQLVEISAATIGNPHCIVLRDRLSADEARSLGPALEQHPFFPHRTNVQFVKILDRHTIAMEIWERGAGYTLASGSSSSAAAGVAQRLGLCDSPITVRMPGGDLHISITDDYFVTLAGPVTRVAEGAFFSP